MYLWRYKFPLCFSNSYTIGDQDSRWFSDQTAGNGEIQRIIQGGNRENIHLNCQNTAIRFSDKVFY